MSCNRGGNRPTPAIGFNLNYLTASDEEVLALTGRLA
jgi:hypothetical protein